MSGDFRGMNDSSRWVYTSWVLLQGACTNLKASLSLQQPCMRLISCYPPVNNPPIWIQTKGSLIHRNPKQDPHVSKLLGKPWTAQVKGEVLETRSVGSQDLVACEPLGEHGLLMNVACLHKGQHFTFTLHTTSWLLSKTHI